MYTLTTRAAEVKRLMTSVARGRKVSSGMSEIHKIGLFTSAMGPKGFVGSAAVVQLDAGSVHPQTFD